MNESPFLASFHKVCNWKAYYINRIDPCGNLGLLNKGSTFNLHSEVVVSTPLTQYCYCQIGASSNSGDQHQTSLVNNAKELSSFFHFYTAFSCKQQKAKPPPPTFWSTTMVTNTMVPYSRKWGTERVPARGNCSLDTQWRNGHLKNVAPDQQMDCRITTESSRSYSHQPWLWSLQKPVAASMEWAWVSFVSSEL